MDCDLFVLQMPDFMPDYDKSESYGYAKQTQKRERLITLLNKTSHGYCMYCYTKVQVDSKQFGHLEHGIEKSADTIGVLEKCVLNMALACPVCNVKFKARFEDERIKNIKSSEEIKALLNKDNCKAHKCNTICQELIDLRKKYTKAQHGHILLQPLSREYSSNLHPVTGNPLHINYDLLRGEFVSDSKNKEIQEKEFIYDHINMFHLNDKVFRTNEVYRFCKDVINNEHINLEKHRYDNMIVDILINALCPLPEDSIRKICEVIYLTGVIRARNMR